MLSFDTSENKLYVHNPITVAWIEYRPKEDEELRPQPQLRDWRLWVYRPSVQRMSLRKSAVRLLVESHLRAWLLRHYQRCLFTLDFNELREIAQRERAHPSLAR